MKKYKEDLLPYNIGQTPMIRLKELLGNNIWLKDEQYNPTGSIKDRSIFGMTRPYIVDKISAKCFVIASSGNAGISLSYLCNIFGFKCIIFMSSAVEKNKIRLIRHFGGQVCLMEGKISTEKDGWVYGAKKYCDEDVKNRIYLDQFNSDLNVKVHQNTTAPEIFNYFEQRKINLNYIFMGVGSGGTSEGILNFIYKNKIDTNIIIAEPIGGILYGLYHGISTQYVDHSIESISDSFKPQNIKNLSFYSDIYQCKDKILEKGRSFLIREEGILAGETCCFVFATIKEYLNMNNITGKNICMLNTDSAFRYL